MAYLVDLDKRCNRCGAKRATVELHNTYNATIGQFCRPCGRKRLAELTTAEHNQ